ncbi:MAG: hypothetical protein RMX65_004065 [Nostoc sp. DedQUE01]
MVLASIYAEKWFAQKNRYKSVVIVRVISGYRDLESIFADVDDE